VRDFLIVCLGEVRKQRKNYFNSWSNYFSLLLWPILTFFTTYYTYSSFDLSVLAPFQLQTQGRFLTFLVTGSLGYNCFWAMVQGAWQIENERQNGTLEIAFLTPGSRMAMMYGRSLGGFIHNVWMFACFAVIVILLNSMITLQTVFAVLGAMVILLVASTVWGGFMTSLFIVTRDSNFLFTVCDEPMNFFSGVKIPVEAFPLWAQAISAIFPSTYCIYIIRAIFLGNAVNGGKAAELIFSMLFMIAATYVILRCAEKRNRETGNLQFY